MEEVEGINILMLCFAVGMFLITVISTICYKVCHSIFFPECDKDYKNHQRLQEEPDFMLFLTTKQFSLEAFNEPLLTAR